jgi:hypothetical protein
MSLGRIFPSYKKGIVPDPEEPMLSTHRRHERAGGSSA